ncbi:MAG: hypothetical protein GY832_12155 [Chloroflexi bacterium]|nr:hypothetical protein [Chloroflexota bacterium]
MQTRNDFGKKLLVFLTVLLVAFSACTPEYSPPGADVERGAFEQTSYTFLRWKQGINILIWHDFVLDSAGSHGPISSTDPWYRGEGYAESKDGHRLDWKAYTTNGKTARFWIDDVPYDLDDGALFIATVGNGELEITQLQRDLSDVQPGRESCLAFARGDPDLAGFVSDIPESMKGYELYSWQVQDEWHFALVVGTNRIKTYEEISSLEASVQGSEALKRELDKLPGGEQVIWSTQWVPNTTLPPDEVIDEIKAHCEQRGIQLVVE